MNEYYVDTMTRHTKTLYTGVTNDLFRRVFQHKTGTGGRSTSKYRIDRLVLYEATNTSRWLSNERSGSSDGRGERTSP